MSLAKHFFEQCVGEFNGQLASMPYNPIMKSIFVAAGYASNLSDSPSEFAKILKQFAAELEKIPDEEKMPF